MNKKTINKLGSQLNEHNSMGISSFALKQMTRMGWSEGKGLGAEEDGRTDIIRAKKREQGEGLGQDKVCAFSLSSAIDRRIPGFNPSAGIALRAYRVDSHLRYALLTSILAHVN